MQTIGLLPTKRFKRSQWTKKSKQHRSIAERKVKIVNNIRDVNNGIPNDHRTSGVAGVSRSFARRLDAFIEAEVELRMKEMQAGLFKSNCTDIHAARANRRNDASEHSSALQNVNDAFTVSGHSGTKHFSPNSKTVKAVSSFTESIEAEADNANIYEAIRDHGEKAERVLSSFSQIAKRLLLCSNKDGIERNEMEVIAESLTQLIKSREFNALPDTFPFHTSMQYLYRRMQEFLKATSDEPNVKLQLTLQQRARLFAILHLVQEYEANR